MHEFITTTLDGLKSSRLLARYNLPRLSTAAHTTLPEVPVADFSFNSTKNLIPTQMLEQILQLAQPLQGLRIGMLNATAYGGGVAEILKSLVPMMRSLGIDVHWYTMPGDDRFYNVTKAFHNALQGAAIDLTEEFKKIYLHYNRTTARLMKNTAVDIWEIHDPQPVAVSAFLELKRSIWRSHIDTSTPNQQVWDFLKPYIARYDELIFTMPQYVHGELAQKNLHYFAPTIDPLSIKNVLLSRDFTASILSAVGIDTKRPLIAQISRFDPWKDPKGVIDVYRMVKNHISNVQLALVGSMAHDDPEGQLIYRDVAAYAQSDPDIHLLTNLNGVGEVEVNCFQTYADVILQKSIREGFGLTVAEAMWKKRPVIGSNAGGITLQINNGLDGFLINSNEECAQRIIQVLQNPKLGYALGEKAHQNIAHNFLHPRLIRDYLSLYHHILGNVLLPEASPAAAQPQLATA